MFFNGVRGLPSPLLKCSHDASAESPHLPEVRAPHQTGLLFIKELQMSYHSMGIL